ncbi:MAG: carboxypeptidase-like regulatory domain-containing protein [Candidatus Latescibacter sp.]|nr:carboxypeptidase-like regulatory domain-containing protein [Candidatus Latescibacter sp.]
MRYFIRIAVLPSLLLIMSCSKKNPAGPADSTGDDFKTGAATVYTVSGGGATSVKDSVVTGATFVFPKGGSGTLSVAPVASAPSLSAEAKKFAVEFSGTESIRIAVPHKTGDRVALFSYGSIGKAAIDGCGIEGWWGIPATGDSSGVTVFELLSPGELTTAKIAGLSQTGTKKYFAIAPYSIGSDIDANIQMIRTKTREAVDVWINNLPSSLQTSARNNVNGTLMYTFAFKDDGNAYVGNNSLLYSNAIFYLNPYPVDNKAGLPTIAHEVGHYMTHVLTGYARYTEIRDRITDLKAYEDHGLTQYREGRKDLLEEYAYFSEFMITGELNGCDLNTKLNVRTFFYEKHNPRDHDYPSQEGYGAVLLATLMRTNGEIVHFDFDKFNPKASIAKIPVVGASFTDILGILARGPRDINELRAFVQDYLDERGNEYRFKLPALLEPLGWTYHGTGKVFDKSGKPFKGVHVQSVSQDGKNEYRTVMSPLTGDDGVFYLPRIYPGSNILRVFSNGDKDSTDVSFNADWSKPTNTALDLGKITVEDVLSTQRLTAKHVTEFKFGDEVLARVTVTATADVTGYGLKSVINPDGKPSDSAIYISAGMPATVKITASSTIELGKTSFGSTTGDYYENWTFGKTRYVFRTSNYNKPPVSLQESVSGNTYTGDFTFKEGDNFSVEVNAWVEDKNEEYEKGKLVESYSGEYYAFGVGFNFYTKSAFSDFSK